MSSQRKNTEFLKWLVGFGEPEHYSALRQRLLLLDREGYHIRRVMTLMSVLLLISLSGIGYSVVFIPDWLGRNLPWVVRIFCAIGLSAGISLLLCVACWMRYKMRLESVNDDCRELIRSTLLTRLNTTPHVDTPSYARRHESQVQAGTG